MGGFYPSRADWENEVARQVRNTIASNQTYSLQARTAVQQRQRGLVHHLVRLTMNVIFGAVLGDLVGRAVDVVWDFFSDLF